MDPARTRIQEDLKGLLEGDLRCDDMFLQLYATDASIYEIRPSCVVRPKNTNDVVACVKYANEHNIPIVPRGAGTGLAGEAVGNGILLDFSYYMRRPISFDGNVARIQPGLVLGQLNRQLAKSGRLFGPDPATRSVTTMGSVVALDASGSHWMKYGSARNKVRKIQMVLGDGEIIETDKIPISQSLAFGHSSDSRELQIARRVHELVSIHKDKIEAYRPLSCTNRSGYYLFDLFENRELDLTKLVVGSEGTLGIITEVEVETDPIPAFRGVVLLFFNRLENAAHAAIDIAEMGASACDLMDRRLLKIARETDPKYDSIVSPNCEAMLLVEFDGDNMNDVRAKLNDAVSIIQRKKNLAFDARTTLETSERNFYWRLTRRVIPRLYRLSGNKRPLPFIEDVAIPPKRLPEFLVQLQRILQKHEVTASLFAHAGHGQLHIRPFIDLGDKSELRRMHALAIEVYEKVVEMKGTVSGEHGDGLSRTWFLRRQFGELYPLFRDVKRIFDSNGILNPGKIFADLPQPLIKNLRAVLPETLSNSAKERSKSKANSYDSLESIPTKKSANEITDDESIEDAGVTDALPIITPALSWSAEELANEARNCNGCGRCRTTMAPERMCPIFRLAPGEEASPRAKANLMRAIMTGQLPPETFKEDEFKQIVDLCVNCHQCRLECPASVDIPKLMVEAKSQHHALAGLSFSESMINRIDWLCAVGSRFRLISNWVIGNQTARWFLEKLVGIAQGRKLPRFSSTNFIRTASRQRLTKQSSQPGRKVVYFVDVYANWLDLQLAEAFVRVMRHNGVEVFVHPKQLYSGMSLFSTGMIDRARKIASRNIQVFVEAIRQGYQVVATEPAAILCLKHEYQDLIGDEDSKTVAENSIDACDYLWQMHSQGNLELDFNPLNATVAYHLPCHQRALENGAPGERLLRLIPGLQVERIEKGCSGMAGTYGLSKKNFRRSLRVGRDLINSIRRPEFVAGTTECSACKMQMEQGTTKPTLHPMKILAYAYGIMPEIQSLFNVRNEGLYVS